MKGLDAGTQRNHPALGFAAEGSALAVDHQAVSLPVEISSFEVGKLGDPESGVKKGPDDEFLWGLQALAKRVASSPVRGSRLY